jgi:hypothetical protein
MSCGSWYTEDKLEEYIGIGRKMGVERSCHISISTGINNLSSLKLKYNLNLL